MRIDAVGIASIGFGACVIATAVLASNVKVEVEEHAAACLHNADLPAGACQAEASEEPFLGSFRALEPAAGADEPND